MHGQGSGDEEEGPQTSPCHHLHSTSAVVLSGRVELARVLHAEQRSGGRHSAGQHDIGLDPVHQGGLGLSVGDDGLAMAPKNSPQASE